MSIASVNTYHNQPDESGRFGIHGGRFVAETLMPLILNVESAYNAARNDKNFRVELNYYQKHYIIYRDPAPKRHNFLSNFKDPAPKAIRAFLRKIQKMQIN